MHHLYDEFGNPTLDDVTYLDAVHGWVRELPFENAFQVIATNVIHHYRIGAY